MKNHQTTVDGISHRWLEHGQGHPVVLVHGIPTSPRLWRHVMPLVEGRSLAWEMLGYGASTGDAGNHDIGLSSQADRLLAWLRQTGVERPVLVGHDLGGGVAQIAATRAPERFSGLVLTNAVSYDSWPIPSVKLMQRMAGLLRQLPDVAIYPSFVQLLLRGHDDHAMARESIKLHWQSYDTHGAARSLMRQVTSLDVNDTTTVADRLPTLGLPARVVWGTADQFQKLAYGERLATDLGTPLTGIADGKHFTPEDHPGAIAGAINDLLIESQRRT
jgi:pimeloyl-ACP methyl ester carboxylesterase